jgi:Flp pilus assembly protein TadG
MRFRGNNERGQSLLETAAVLPLVLLVSVGIFEFGRAYHTWQVITNAAREGARVAILPGTTTTDVQTRVHDYLQAGQIDIKTWSPTWVVQTPTTVSIGLGTAPATQVTVNYPFSFIVLNPVARLVVKNSTVGGAALTMSAIAVMRNE